MSQLHVDIVTPEGVRLAQDVDMVTLPGQEGEMGVFPNHEPLITRIVPGELILQSGGERKVLAVGEGFVRISAERVTLLSDMALYEEEIEEAKVAEAVERAQQALRRKELGEEEQAATAALLARSLAQLKVKRRHRSA
ncbi:F-type H+-transporting ATPase subunit epsilon [Methylacidimicrobium cyclopophantes]|uniref:ATP synthase epsilon chain n=1 Tax=Methylacidimicrobium cyclopophantes TaxID=1041766 RepID=A0A5E6M9T2_9BACT|nr:ATP synthase F1 subunit epsilon [Methylacidimicrobium cyclopophantes]VVM05113.1 F-type H+-transporting ATPase subunit epsilon [Methylacidimicrobium cyclopophantes]